MPTFPEWWNWDLAFTSHAELRMDQRGVTEVDVRAMLQRATEFKPDTDVNLLVVVTVYEVFE